uniref:HTH cro/C1-type domain-containing protein n=1 Tax=Tanacetum cinerariifolium TaxID=118510 RepID=A0A699GEM4_TANCI|nr:hypothetical protein [Tanacetum cinerariifolium]
MLDGRDFAHRVDGKIGRFAVFLFLHVHHVQVVRRLQFFQQREHARGTRVGTMMQREMGRHGGLLIENFRIAAAIMTVLEKHAGCHDHAINVARPVQGGTESGRRRQAVPARALCRAARPGAVHRMVLAGRVGLAAGRVAHAAHAAVALRAGGVRPRPHGGIRRDDQGIQLHAVRARPRAGRALPARGVSWLSGARRADDRRLRAAALCPRYPAARTAGATGAAPCPHRTSGKNHGADTPASGSDPGGPTGRAGRHERACAAGAVPRQRGRQPQVGDPPQSPARRRRPAGPRRRPRPGHAGAKPGLLRPGALHVGLRTFGGQAAGGLSAHWPLYWFPEEYAAFIAFIASNPDAGDVVPGSGGVRKVRWRRQGSGKSGGVRVIYFTRNKAAEVVLLTLDEELETFEANRDLGAELLQAGREMKAGLGRVVYSPLIAARENTGLTREQFAGLLGMTVEELEKLEQDRNPLNGAVRTLIAVALSHPDALVAAAKQSQEA